ncbi:MAG: CBS domain-containing protein [Deltaproteobacteria bacterium]|nr:CBS domain-containing protein [Deltaproteobacteria bacterium]
MLSLLPTATIEAARDQMVISAVSSLAILGPAGNLVGVLSRGDLLRLGRAGARTDSAARPALALGPEGVQTRMHREVVTVGVAGTMVEVARLLASNHIHRVFVLDGARLVGVIGCQDVMRAVAARRVTAPVSLYMSAPVHACGLDEPLGLVIDRLGELQIHGLVVIDGERPVGVFTQREALAVHARPAETQIEEVMSYGNVRVQASAPMHEAAALALTRRARQVLALDGRQLRGILTGIDFALALARAGVPAAGF